MFGQNFGVMYAASRGLTSLNKTISSLYGGNGLPTWEDYLDNRDEGISRFAGGVYAGAKAIGKVAGRTKDAALAIAQAHEEGFERRGLTVKRSPSYTTLEPNLLKPTKQGKQGIKQLRSLPWRLRIHSFIIRRGELVF